MMRAMKRRRGRSPFARLVRPLVSVGLLGAGLVLSGAFVGIAMRESTVRSDVRAAQADIAREQAHRAELLAEVAQRKTDQDIVDRARELGFVRPGEGLIAVERGPSGEPIVRLNASDGGRLGRWLAVFFAKR